MFKVCLYVINILLPNCGSEGKGVRTPGWQHGFCHLPFAMLATSLENGVWNLGFRNLGFGF